MERYLISGTEIKLKGIDGHYVIKDIIGRGSSCVVYSADFYNNNNEKTEHLLKEFNPRCIDLKRDAEGLAPLKDDEKEHFESLCNRFKEGFEKQSALRTIPELKNYTANIQNVYYDHGTVYIDMTETNGKSYAEVEEKSIYNLAQRIRVLAQVIGHYHEHGYLHLDIKPSNIFARPEDETCQDVLLFDFDSLVPFREKDGKCVIDKNASVSYTTEYAPVELLTASRRGRICKATDIYEIGEIFFEKLMGRHSTALEHNAWADYEYDRSAQIFENVNPKVISLLNELFTHILCNDVNMRYQSTDELIECLDKIIEFSNPKEPYLEKNNLPNVSGFFTGRDNEIEEIHKRLQENNVLFLSGIGGIGKSELAKHYAEIHKDSYDAIIFASFVHDVQMMIADDKYVQIHNFFQYPEEKPDKYFERKMKELANLCNERTLFIVDNFDTTEDENLDKLLSLNCKMLITTRRDFSGFNKQQICVDKLQSKSEIRKIFDTYYKVSDEEESACVDEIIELVEGHTMTVELIAKQIEAEWATADEILDKLKEAGISGIGESDVDSGKDNGFKRRSTYNHIKALFNLSVFEKDADTSKEAGDNNFIYILANLSLIPHTGIDGKLFAQWCELDKHGGKNCLNTLIKSGWIREERKEKNKFISLHPVLIDIFQYKICEKNVHILISHFSQILVDDNTGEIILSVDEFGFANRIAKSIFKHIIERRVELNIEIIDYVSNIGLFFYEQNLLDFAEKIYCLVQEYFKNSNVHNPYLEVVILNNISLIYDKQAELYNKKYLSYKAIDSLLECLSIAKKPTNNLNEYVGTIQGNIGSAYHTLKDFKNAEKYYKMAIATTDRYNFYTLLGVLYNDIMEYNIALEMHQKAMEKAVCNNDPPLAIALIEHNMAVSYKKLGLLNDAAIHCNNVLRIREKAFDGGESYDLALTQSLLGQVYVELGDEKLVQEAERLLQKAVLTFENSVGIEHEEYKKAKISLQQIKH